MSLYLRLNAFSAMAAGKNSFLPIEGKTNRQMLFIKKGAKKATKTDKSTSERGIICGFGGILGTGPVGQQYSQIYQLVILVSCKSVSPLAKIMYLLPPFPQ